MASNKAFVRVMVVLAMLVLLATPSTAAGIFECYKECKPGCEGKLKCLLTCIPTCLATGGGGAGGAQTADSECKRHCFSSNCIKFVDDEKKAIDCMKSCDHSCESNI